VHISLIPDTDYLAAIAEGLDGILLPGSDSDVDPLRYGQDPHPMLGRVHPLKDETDLIILGELEQRGMPLLAICFGMQALNVYRGGTLIQDISSQVPAAIKHEQGAPRDRPSHRVKLLEGSLLFSLAGRDSVVVNSHHHQAIESLGSHLTATAWTSDGLVEAVEDPRSDRFVMAVQWHPELGWRNDSLSRALFARFVSATRQYADRRESEDSLAAAGILEKEGN
jgi:putative glutamine amidotransferase